MTNGIITIVPGYRSAIHTYRRWRYAIYCLFYGPNPFGPRGGVHGNPENAECVAQTSNYPGAGCPRWIRMMEAILNDLSGSNFTGTIERAALESGARELARKGYRP